MLPASIVLLASLAQVGQCLFSVHDDILALPQYDIRFPDAIVSVEEAEAILSLSPAGTFGNRGANDADEAKESYELMRLHVDRKFLCAIPAVKPPPPMNATEKELSKVEEEKELARATSRGWELLSDLDGKCLYFVSGWWSYSFCHNREVRQFHQLPPQQNNQWPPTEDPETQSYVLGQVSQDGSAGGSSGGVGEGTELQATGELRYLVQRLGGGTVCDLTGKERKIEVQFHCNSHGTDRIDWIKEVSICCYLMVIYTPRLCNDVTFLPPRDNKANAISCREVMDEKQREEYYKRRAENLLDDAQEQSQQGQEEEQEQQMSDAAAETAIKNPDKKKKKEKEKKKNADEKTADGIEELLHILQQEL